MITLSDGSTTLTLNHVLWTNRSRDKALGNEKVTIGNRLVIQRLAGSAGRDIILESMLQGTDLLGWFSWAQVEQLMLWRDSGTQLVLHYDNDIRTCVVPLSGIDIEPVFLRSKSIDPDTKCTGILSLKEV